MAPSSVTANSIQSGMACVFTSLSSILPWHLFLTKFLPYSFATHRLYADSVPWPGQATWPYVFKTPSNPHAPLIIIFIIIIQIYSFQLTPQFAYLVKLHLPSNDKEPAPKIRLPSFGPNDFEALSKEFVAKKPTTPNSGTTTSPRYSLNWFPFNTIGIF